MALLTKDDVPRIRENLRTCADFLRSVRFVLDVNSFEFYTKGAWCEHVVPALCPRDVIGAAREFGASAAVIRENCDHTWGIDVHQQKLVNVNLFLRAAAHHTLAGLGFLLSTRDIFHLFQSSVHTEFQEPSLMCDKKCHEVALLSRLVVALVQHCSLNQVIDIGSGKGYLSSHLSECYGLKVIGIDASNTVTCGAHDRTQKLQKFLSRRQKARCKTGTVPPIVIGESIDNETSGMKIEVGTNTIDTDGESDIHWTTESAVFTGKGCNSVERINTEKMIDTPILIPKNIERVFPETTQTGRPLQPNERQNTDGVQVNDNMEQHFANGLNTSCSSTTISSCEAQRMNNQELAAATERTTNVAGLFSPVTLQLTHKTNLEQLFPALEDSVLVGLHTCGNLGSNILRVFLCHKQLRALSNVGCCYHLLTETSPLGADAEDPCGFPMSQFLLKSGFMLGRNMKMTACLAPERAARGKGVRTLVFCFNMYFIII
uniref:Methyltransferase domain-containing protein n=1 Tax=Eptatretus burgeri TaxID=7764 RepID=A0A8C4PX01_EPTBU